MIVKHRSAVAARWLAWVRTDDERAQDDIRPSVGLVACSAAALVGVAWFTRIELARLSSLAAPAYDQAIFLQIAWNLGHGRGFATSFAPVSYLGVHFSPLLVLTAPIGRLLPEPSLLVVLNTVPLTLSGPAAYLFLSALLAGLPAGRLLSAIIAAPMPVWAGVQEAASAGFHPEVLALPLALLAARAAVTGSPWTMWPLSFVVLTAKEDQLYTVLLIALLAVTVGNDRMRRQGSILALAAIVYGAAVLGLAMPLIRHGQYVDTGGYYSWLLHPGLGAVVSSVVRPEPWLSGLGLLAAVGFLPLLRPPWLAVLLPPFVADLLSHHFPQDNIRLHYTLILILPLLIAAGMGARRVLPLMGQVRPRLIALALLPLASGLWLGPLPPALNRAVPDPYDRPSASARLAAAASQVPPTAPVAADDGLLPAFAARADIQVFPRSRDDMYVIVDRRAYLSVYVDQADRSAKLAGLTARRRLLTNDGRFEVWAPVSNAR
jgi:uncharacterized membrane protein